MIWSLRHKFPVQELSRILGCSRAGYYRWLKRKHIKTAKDTDDKVLADFILKIYRQRKIYGYRRIAQRLFKQYQLKINHKRVRRIMQMLGIRSIIRRRRYPKPVGILTPVKCPNLLQRNFGASQPGQKLVTDITYLFVGKQRYYMAAIVDLFNNQVVSYHLSDSPDLRLVLTTLDKWLAKGKDVQGAIVHSDQGATYTSPIYSSVLKRHGIIQSMSPPGSPLDNAPMESFLSHLKCEAIYTNDIRTFEELQSIIDEYMAFYNHERPHTRLNGCAPVEFLNECA